jgi:hypothetical protein
MLVAVANLTQALVPQPALREMTRRMMSLYTSGAMGTTPLGGLLIGWVMDAASLRAAVGMGGSAMAIGRARRPDRSLAMDPH